MIKLLVEDYCHECPEFYPEKIYDSDAYREFGPNVGNMYDTYVACEYRKRCRTIAKYMEKNRDT